MSRITAIFGIAIVSLIIILWWAVNHFYGAYQTAKSRADSAEQQITAAEAVTSNVLTTMSIFNTISESNKNAKEQIALDASGASSDIKVAVANDDCAHRPVPDGAVKRLQRYADSLRQGASGSPSGKPDS